MQLTPVLIIWVIVLFQVRAAAPIAGLIGGGVQMMTLFAILMLNIGDVITINVFIAAAFVALAALIRRTRQNHQSLLCP